MTNYLEFRYLEINTKKKLINIMKTDKKCQMEIISKTYFSSYIVIALMEQAFEQD